MEERLRVINTILTHIIIPRSNGVDTVKTSEKPSHGEFRERNVYEVVALHKAQELVVAAIFGDLLCKR
jgi:hypothetical protein